MTRTAGGSEGGEWKRERGREQNEVGIESRMKSERGWPSRLGLAPLRIQLPLSSYHLDVLDGSMQSLLLIFIWQN